MKKEKAIKGCRSETRPSYGSSALMLLAVSALAWCSTQLGCEGQKSDGSVNRNGPIEIRKPLPTFSLTRQDGRTFGSEDLKGSVWIANFVFTRCASTCPRQTRDFARFQKELADHPRLDGMHFVSITVDPEYDTTDRLTAYGNDYKADFDHWSFLTGERKKIWELSSKGFGLAVFEGSQNDPGMLITHSEKFVLVDRENNIRGFYDSSDAKDWAKLKKKLEAILQENEPAAEDVTADSSQS